MFGESKTSKFLVGTFEARIGPMTQAGALSSVHSVGVVDNFSLQLDMQKVELTESFPARIVDTALSSSLSSFSLNLKEYSARNVRTLLSSGIAPYTPSVSRLVAKGVSPTVLLVKRVGTTTITVDATTTAAEVEVDASKMVISKSEYANNVWAEVTTTAGTPQLYKVKAVKDFSGTLLISTAKDDYDGLDPDIKFSDPTTNDQITAITAPLGTTSPTGIVAVGHGPRNYLDDNDELYLKIATQVGKLYDVTIPLYVLQGTINVAIKNNTTLDGTRVSQYLPKHTPGGFKNITLRFVANDKTTSIVFGTNQGRDVFYILPQGITAKESPNTSIEKGDVVTIFEDANPANVTVAVVLSKTSDSITIEAPGLNQAIPPGSPYTVYKNEVVSAGEPDPTKQFFSATLVQLDRGTGAPLVFDFWKCSVSSGLNLSVNNSSFSSMDMQVKVLKPSARDYSPIGSLAHLSQVIPRFPTWRYSAMPD